MPPLFTGAILAGGSSVRMGRDKAFLPFGGKTLLETQVERLQQLGCDDLVISGRPGVDYRQHLARVVCDEVPGLGPLGGLAAVLDAARHPWVLVVAVDLPCLTVPWLSALLDRGADGRGVVPRSPRGHEPLAALYPRSALSRVHLALSRRELSLQTLVDGLIAAGLVRTMELGEADMSALLNWNRPGDV